jgi:hypothetical protein
MGAIIIQHDDIPTWLPESLQNDGPYHHSRQVIRSCSGVVAILNGLESSEAEEFPDLEPVLTACSKSSVLLEKICLISTLGVRSVPNEDSISKWIPIAEDPRKILSQVASELRWSESQVVQEAIHTAGYLLRPGHDLEQLPSLLALLWGKRLLEKKRRDELKAKIGGAKLITEGLAVPLPKHTSFTSDMELKE